MNHVHTRVIHNTDAARGYKSLRFSWTGFSDSPQAGQFMTIRVKGSPVPLLRRPFAFSDAGENWAEILYEKRGTATKVLAGLQPGDDLDVLGPLGNFFQQPQPGTRPVLIGGGIGMGPILFWAKTLETQGYNPLLIIGARDSGLIPTISFGPSIEYIPATDDGSLGFHGNVVTCLENSVGDQDRLEIYSCGPNPMMQALHSWAELRSTQATVWVSMEQTMGCAVGACMGCVVKVNGDQPYARVCMEGPIFDSRIIDWKGGAGHEYL